MKRLILGVAAALLLSAGPAVADGLPSKGYVRGAELPFHWGGYYAGLHAGVAVGNTQGDIGGIVSDYELNGALYGVQLGWLGQWGNIVAGLEGSYSGSAVQGSDAGCLVIVIGFDCRREVNSLATVVGRAGIAHGRILVYGLAGVAWADVDTDIKVLNQIPLLSGGETHYGWTAGFGVEWAVTNRISARVEYAHIDLGDQTTTLDLIGLPLVKDRVALEMDTVRLGINVRLGQHD